MDDDDDDPSILDARIGGLVDGRYRVLQAMASGSMGVVYKAERVPVGKVVAIKFLHATFAHDSEFLARFERETRVMSKLTHPNCVSVVDFGVWEGAPYLVMEYVSGTTLRAVIDNGALPPKRALALARQIAAGLAHAHAQGIVHRDVKPANIMISEEIGTGDHARILDFGLARLRGAVGRDATQSNVVVGTPNYMAPEQTVGGGLIDARTDIYAAGVVLFEMVCGDRPFQAEDTLALLGMHRAAPIPKLADRLRGGVKLPRGLQEVVEKAMAKSPSDRYQSAIELAEAIDAVWSSRPPSQTGDVVVRRSPDAKKVTGTAPTLLDVTDDDELVEPAVPRRPVRRKSSFGSLIVLTALVAGVGASVWWVMLRSEDKPAGRYSRVDTGARSNGASGTASSSKLPTGSVGSAGSASHASTAPGAPSPEAATAVQGSADGSAAGGDGSAADSVGSNAASAEPGSAGTVEPAADPAGSGADMGAGSAVEPVTAGSAAEPIAPPPAAEPGPAPPGAERPDVAGTVPDSVDPATAVDPAPPSSKPTRNDDEAANAPKSTAEVEKRTKPTPVLATTLNGAVRLIEEGKRDQALASLQALWKKTPASAYIPFLLGNLYYDQQWWSVAMEHYAAAIKKNATYRKNPTLNRNVIQMLASNKTARKAQGFLKFTVGKAALPYVRYAAQHDNNGQVKRLSAWLAKTI